MNGTSGMCEARAERSSEAPRGSRERWLIALGVYFTAVLVLGVFADYDRIWRHTPYNHYAHLADAWLHRRNDIAGGAPPYSGGNDFAEYDRKTYVTFPPFPAVLMLPLVWLARSPENFRDGQFIVWLSGVGPAVLFLVLEKLRRMEFSERSERSNVVLSLAFTFGSVYFFSAIQGTVWFAAHVVGIAALVLYVLFALDCEWPFLAGVAMACAWTTRPLMLMSSILFACEAVRVSCKDFAEIEGGLLQRAATLWGDVDRRTLARRLSLFAVPLAVSFTVCGAYNAARFGDPRPFGFGH